MWRVVPIALAVVLGAALVARTVLAQNAPAPPPPMHGAQMHKSHGAAAGASHASAAAGAPGLPGQDAFGAIAEVVRILDADPSTDWSRVDLERLRQHLIDMNEVVLRAAVKQTPVPDGLSMEITGTGRTEQAILAMVIPHAAELDRMPSFTARTEPIGGGVRLTVTAKAPSDDKAVARVRGLGFIGLLTAGAHHAPHHLAMAKGEAVGAHSH